MKRFAFILFCLLCAAGGVALGRYGWAAPVEDTPVMQPSAKAAAHSGGKGQGVKEALAAVRNGPRRAALIVSLAARNGSRNLPALIEACAGDEAALQFLAETWLKTSDPGAFAKALAGSAAILGHQRMHCLKVLHEFMESWGKKAPDEAWEMAESFSGTSRRYVLGRLADRRIGTDPHAGLRFLREHPGVAPMDPPGIKTGGQSAELLPLVKALPECAGKKELLRQVLRELPLAEAMEALKTEKDSITAAARYQVLTNTALRSPKEVMAWHDAATGSERYTAAQVVGETLLHRDPAGAAAWAAENMSGNARLVLLRKAAEKLDSTDPAAAAGARELLPETGRTREVK